MISAVQTLKGIRRGQIKRRQTARNVAAARDVFANWEDYRTAATTVDDGETILRTLSGLSIAIRHNTWDAMIVAEQFIDKSYLRYKPPVASPIIVDIGSYIGDFAIYCAHELSAQVVAYEPAAENFAMLAKNIALNPALRHRVMAVPRGVSSSPTIVSHVQTQGREVHVSSVWYADDPDAQERTFQCDTLADIVGRLDHVDLLKVDCEGGEYDIFTDVPADVYAKVHSIVLEWHRVPGWEQKRPALEATLRAVSFDLDLDGQLLYAYRL